VEKTEGGKTTRPCSEDYAKGTHVSKKQKQCPPARQRKKDKPPSLREEEKYEEGKARKIYILKIISCKP